MRNPTHPVAQYCEADLEPHCSRILRQKLKMSDKARDGCAQLMRRIGDELALRACRFSQHFK